MSSTETQIKARLEALPKMHTTTITGKVVTRWNELYEVSTWAKVENLGTLEETLVKLTKKG